MQCILFHVIDSFRYQQLNASVELISQNYQIHIYELQLNPFGSIYFPFIDKNRPQKYTSFGDLKFKVVPPFFSLYL